MHCFQRARTGRRSESRFGRFTTGVICAGLLLSLAWPGLGGGDGAAQARSENKILLLAKTAVYGGLTGLLLGGVAALVVDSDSRDDAVRWGVVLGTFGGFAYGIYTLSTSDDEDFFLRRPGYPTDLGAAEGRVFLRDHWGIGAGAALSRVNLSDSRGSSPGGSGLLRTASTPHRLGSTSAFGHPRSSTFGAEPATGGAAGVDSTSGDEVAALP